MDVNKLSQYELLEKKDVKDLQSVGYRLRHKKSGAKFLLLENDDKNKVFAIAFRTPAEDSTGVPHILEHSVLCGSKKFPVKDPFIELAKGSLNTFLNAMTYPDKTVYPVASTNDKDFRNLCDVYMDAVLHPNIYKRPEIFKQEGWHYEMEAKDGPVSYNGVVYNEMKGVYSNPDDILSRYIYASLYPDTQYANESGGDPDCIPTLTYEDFLAFHKRYYHPSNSYIYLYGNMDMEEQLIWLDREYLSEYSLDTVDSRILRQSPFSEPVYLEKEYSIAEEEPLEDNSYLSANYCIGDNLDPKLYIAFQILEYALLDVPGAPLMQALLDRGIGKDIEGSYENGIQQPCFSIIARNTEAGKKEEFLSTIKEVLTELSEKGLDKKALKAGINYFEFRYREADFGNYPKGLMYGLQSFDSWLYDDEKPFMHIEQNSTFAFLKEAVDSGYFEELIKKYLLNNDHSSVVVLRPKRGLIAEMDKAREEKLAKYKDSLSEKDVEGIISDTARLKAYQDAPSTAEELAAIPMLSISDIEKKADKLKNKLNEAEGINLLHHDVYTNGIIYLGLLFDTDPVPRELVPYLGIWRSVLGQLDTENYSYGELNNEINLESGGIYFTLSVYPDLKAPGEFRSMFEARGKFLDEKLPFAFKMIPEILFTSKLDDRKRLKEVISMMKSRMSSSMAAAGHSTASLRAMSYFSAQSAYAEESNGVTFYDLVSDLEEHFDEKAADLIQKLNRVKSLVLHRDLLMADVTGSAESCLKVSEKLGDFAAGLSGEVSHRGEWQFSDNIRNEGFKTASQVQYVAKAADFKKEGLSYSGALKVLKVIMGYDYLWQNVRVKGGAYGCMSAWARTGECYMVSYRDPHLKETLEIFNNAGDYIADFSASDRDMTKYIIGTISDMDTPLTPRGEGARGLSAFLSNYGDEDLQKERDEVLGTDVNAIRALAPFGFALKNSPIICIVGGEEKIEENKGLFKETRQLV